MEIPEWEQKQDLNLNKATSQSNICLSGQADDRLWSDSKPVCNEINKMMVNVEVVCEVPHLV